MRYAFMTLQNFQPGIRISVGIHSVVAYACTIDREERYHCGGSTSFDILSDTINIGKRVNVQRKFGVAWKDTTYVKMRSKVLAELWLLISSRDILYKYRSSKKSRSWIRICWIFIIYKWTILSLNGKIALLNRET